MTTNDNALRPVALSDIIGIEDNRRRIKTSIDAAKARQEPMPHVLIHGSRGLGKTTLSLAIANELGTKLTISNAATLKKAQDLVQVLRDLKQGDVLFIDEIHSLPKTIEEFLFTVMEDFRMSYPVGSTRVIAEIKVKPFTLIGATTHVGKISAPLIDRFRIREELTPYTDEHIRHITQINAFKLKCNMTKEAAHAIAVRSRGTPRLSVNYLFWVRDYAQMKGVQELDENIVNEAMLDKGITADGFTAADRRYINTIWQDFAGGPAGVNALSNAMLMEVCTLENDVEPYIMQRGLLLRTKGGRQLTTEGIAYAQDLKGKI